MFRPRRKGDHHCDRSKGKFNTALCYTPALDGKAEEQIRLVCDEEAFRDSKIRIMPDVHAGKGCTIGDDHDHYG